MEPLHTDHSAAVIQRFAQDRLVDRRHVLGARFRVHTGAVTLPMLARIKADLTLRPRGAGTGKRGAPAADPTFTAWVYSGGAGRWTEPAPAAPLEDPGGASGGFEPTWTCRATTAWPRWACPRATRTAAHWAHALSPAVAFAGRLRADGPYQVEAVAAAERVLRSPVGGCILQLGCGQGKTVCALALAARLGRRTAVLVNNGKTLLPQWQARIAQFLPGARVGVVRGPRVDLADPAVDVVVCVIQSLAKRTYPPRLMATVGTVIVDEAHHVGARVFAQCLRQFRARYTLGLTATPDRKDGLRSYVEWLVGPVAFACPTDFRRVVVLRATYPDTRVQPHAAAKDHLQRCLMVNDAAADVPRTLLLLRFVGNVVKESPRRVLVLTERVQQVDDFAGYLAAGGIAVARLHAGVPAGQVAAADSARVVVANYPMASEALDIAGLDTIVTLTPVVGFIEQVVGRIVRIAADKRRPLVVDWVDPVGLFAGMARTRRKWYAAVAVAGIHDVTVLAAALQDPAAYNAVKPSAAVAAWLAEADPWNTPPPTPQ
jgi:superfamily II DNA or RNA helicase